jgi:Cyclin
MDFLDTTAKVIEAIWPTVNKPKANVVSLRTFIQEVLKRSRTTYSTLQTALFYLFRVKNAIIHQLQGQSMTTTIRREQDYISCGRRMFLASLILASKFLQDRNYRNSAWAKISGLPVSEINAAEMVFLKLIDCNLFISKATFDQWYNLLNTHIENRVTRQPTVNNNKSSSQPPSCYLQPTPSNQQNIPTSLQPLSPPLSQSSSSPFNACNTPQYPHDSAVSLSQDNFSPPLSGKLSGKRSYSDEDEASLAIKRVKTDKDDFSLIMGW